MISTYQNPMPIKNIGDPFVLRAPDRAYYCCTSSAPDGFKSWMSEDFVYWAEIGMSINARRIPGAPLIFGQ